MRNLIFRAAVIALLVYLFKNSTDKGQKAFDRVVNWGRGVMTGANLGTMGKELNREYAFSGNLPRDFPAWIRETVKHNDGTDPALDQWGQVLVMTIPPGAPPGAYELRSCGPDRTCRTPDDIVHAGRAEKFE